MKPIINRITGEKIPIFKYLFIGFLFTILILVLWIGGAILLVQSNRTIISAFELLYYICVGIAIILHPMISKILPLNRRESMQMTQEPGSKVQIDSRPPWWWYVFSYMGLIYLSFPMSHMIHVVMFIPIRSVILTLLLASVAVLSLFLGMLTVREKLLGKEATREGELRLLNFGFTVALSVGLCVLIGYLTIHLAPV